MGDTRLDTRWGVGVGNGPGRALAIGAPGGLLWAHLQGHRDLGRQVGGGGVFTTIQHRVGVVGGPCSLSSISSPPQRPL